MKELEIFVADISRSVERKSFVKITLSKPTRPADKLVNVYIRLVEIKNQTNLSFTYHFATNDQVKNFSLEAGIHELQILMKDSFQHSTLFTTHEDVLFRMSKKGNASISKIKPSFSDVPGVAHDRQKVKRTDHQDHYLIALGVMDSQGVVIPKMADKFKQINKYLEIMEGLIKSLTFHDPIKIVDMGSGKGYLTFALYDYLRNKLELNVKVTGIEQRQELVDYCNATAQACGFDNLNFENKSIEAYQDDETDIVIALHACDTATDDAIAKAISANASLIVCAPCCHKQIRQQVKGKEQNSPLMKYGIFKERQFEMVTDTIRALIMEKKNYHTKIFEFVSNEHTRKNVLLVGTKNQQPTDEDDIAEKLNSIKRAYQIDYHYLEKLVH